MIFTSSNDPKVIEAVEFANDLFSGAHSFYLRIERMNFDMTSYSGKGIALDIKYTTRFHGIEYKVYRPWWRWSKAIGYFSPKHPFRIHVNKYKLKNMRFDQVVGNICHEVVHLSDNLNKNERYGHGSNTNINGKKNATAPYWIGILGKQIAKKIQTSRQDRAL